MAEPINIKPYASTRYLTVLAFCLVAAFSTHWLTAIFDHDLYPGKLWLGHFTVIQFSVLTLLMLFAGYFGPKSQNIRDYQWLLVTGIILRILVIPSEPYTSNDVDRYLFDGYIATQGLDPYSISHDAPQLRSAVKEWHPPNEHLKYTTIYPPMAIALFSIAASLGPELAELIWSMMIFCASVLTLYFAVLTLKHAKKLQHLPLIALSPILIFESGIGLHIDSFSALFVILSLYLWLKNSVFYVGVFLGMGMLVKLLPLVLMGPLWLFLKTWKTRFSLLTGFSLTLITGYLMAFLFGWYPLGSLGVFFEKFRFGSPIFVLLEQTLSLDYLFLTLLVLFVSGYGLIAIYVYKTSQKNYNMANQGLIYSLQASLSLPLIFGPVVYPWYLMTLVPLVALAPNRLALTWLATLPFTYEVLGNWSCCRIWQPASWPLISISFFLSMALLSLYKQPKIGSGISSPEPKLLEQEKVEPEVIVDSNQTS